MPEPTIPGDLRERLVSALHQCFAGQGDTGRIHMYDPESGECTPCEGRADAVLPVVEAEIADLWHRLEVPARDAAAACAAACNERDDALAAVQRAWTASRAHRVGHPKPVSGCVPCRILAALEPPQSRG